MKLAFRHFAIAVVLAAAGATLAAQTVKITGAGATFPFPIYSKWFSEYNKLHSNVEINYQSIGSGGGIRQLLSQTVFFGATDGPMTDEQLKTAPGPILHLPTVLGAVVPVYNVPGVTTDLKFTGMVLPSAKVVSYAIDLKRVVMRRLVIGIADGVMKVDGQTIYEAKDLRVGLFVDGGNPAAA